MTATVPAETIAVLPTDAAETPSISVDAVTKSFGMLNAVDDVTVAIPPGEIVGLIGPNGSGKTTLLRLLSGLAHPTSGDVRVLGTDPRDAAVRRRFGVVSGRFPVARRRTVGETIRHVAALRQLPDTGRAETLAKWLDLDLERRADELSRGNLQKLAIVQALMHQPDVLLLDEPTVGLDPIAQEAFRNLLIDEHRCGTTIVMSSHVLSAVDSVATRLLAIRHGRIVIDGPVDEVLATSGRLVSLLLHELDVHRVSPLLDDVATTEALDGLQQVSGRYAGEIDRLLSLLAGLDVRDLTIARPQLHDLVEDIYQEDQP